FSPSGVAEYSTSSDVPPANVEYSATPLGLNFVTKGRNTGEPAYTLAAPAACAPGSTATGPTIVPAKRFPAFVEVDQVLPPSVVLNTPPVKVPTNAVPATKGSTAIPETLRSVRPLFAWLQVL